MSNENQPENVDLMSEAQPAHGELTAETSATITDQPSTATEVDDVMTGDVQSQEVDSKPLVYVGPTLKGLSQYSVFINGIPPYVESMIERCPELRSLFLSVQEFPKRREESHLVGSELYVSYQAVLKTKGV